jgi:hypothetical protein
MEFEVVEVTYKFKLGKPMMEKDIKTRELSTNMRQLYEYYIFDTIGKKYDGFDVIVVPNVPWFCNSNKLWYLVLYEDLFQLYQRCDLDKQMRMLWTLYVPYTWFIIVFTE